MKNKETLLSLIATLLYWIFKLYTNWVADKPKTSQGQPTHKHNAKRRPIASPIAEPSLANYQQVQPVSTQAIPFVREKEKLVPAMEPSQGKANRPINKQNRLTRKLARYNHLQQSIIFQEILTPKYRA